MNSYLQDKFLLLHLVAAWTNRFLLVSAMVRSGREQRGVFISSRVASSRVREKTRNHRNGGLRNAGGIERWEMKGQECTRRAKVHTQEPNGAWHQPQHAVVTPTEH